MVSINIKESQKFTLDNTLCVRICSEVMSHPVLTLRTVEKVGRIIEILQREKHAGFPVVEDLHPSQVRYKQ